MSWSSSCSCLTLPVDQLSRLSGTFRPSLPGVHCTFGRQYTSYRITCRCARMKNLATELSRNKNHHVRCTRCSTVDRMLRNRQGHATPCTHGRPAIVLPQLYSVRYASATRIQVSCHDTGLARLAHCSKHNRTARLQQTRYAVAATSAKTPPRY